MRLASLLPGEISVDLFAGGGGASTGFFLATGGHPYAAVNHDPEAIAMHTANHPSTKHYCASVWQVSARDVIGRKRLGLLWASPDCTHFSRAKGGKPVETGRRALAEVVIEWARDARPRMICLENVAEFLTWGPLGPDNRPCPRRKGEDFRAWVAQLHWLGYEVEWRSLVAADYGAPTSRKRLFLVARRDGAPIRWPEPTHGPGQARPWRTAAEIIDWSVPTRSVFGRERPLKPATMRRIARGLKRFVIEAAEPFIVTLRGTAPSQLDGSARSIDAPIGTVSAGGIHHALITPTITGYGERKGQAPRILDLHKPLGAVVAGGSKHGLVTAWMTKHYGGVTGHGLGRPLGAVTTQDHHSLTTATLHPCGVDRRAEVRDLVEGEALVTIGGEVFEIADVGMRMLTPRELFRAQGFPESYDLLDGQMTQGAQIRLAGNSVCPDVAAALIRANLEARPARRTPARPVYELTMGGQVWWAATSSLQRQRWVSRMGGPYRRPMTKPLRPAITPTPMGVRLSLRGSVPPEPGRPMLTEIDGGLEDGFDGDFEAEPGEPDELGPRPQRRPTDDATPTAPPPRQDPPRQAAGWPPRPPRG